jgi:ubiquinone/menaquinone biosynthesis C-methylase UbiE
MTDHRPHQYVPALRYDVLTPFYDVIAATLLREQTLKEHLIAQAQTNPGTRALDVGCGTGTLALLAKHTLPTTTFVGIDWLYGRTQDRRICHAAGHVNLLYGSKTSLTVCFRRTPHSTTP